MTTELITAAINSTARVILGFLIASMSAIFLALFIYQIKRLQKVVTLLVELLRPISPLAWAPVGLMFFGANDYSVIFIVFIATFFPVFLNVFQGLLNHKESNQELITVYNLNQLQGLIYIILPSIISEIFIGLKVGFGVGWISIVAGEQLGIGRGLGTEIQIARYTLDHQKLFITMLIIGLIGVSFNLLFNNIDTKLQKYGFNVRN